MIFDISRLESISEKPLLRDALLAKRILPYMQVAGLLHLTDQRLYFQDLYKTSSNPVKSIRHYEIIRLYRRRWRLRNLGFELQTRQGRSLFIAFYSERDRDLIYQ